MELIEYPDREMMMIDLANVLAGELNSALMSHDAASLAVPGGSTPGPIFDSLCAASLDWDRVTVMPTDERWVPESSEHSNARLIRERLLTGNAAKAKFFPFFVEGTSQDDSLDGLTAGIKPHLPLSVLVLGMGADMHVASLFPGSDALSEEFRHGNSPIIYPVKMPGLEPLVARMTLTPWVLNDAMSKHIVITGADKRQALERAQELGDPVQAPICAVLTDATIHWAE